MKTTTVKIGRSIHLDVDVRGEPPPEVKWFFKGEEVFSGQLIKYSLTI